MKIFLSYPSAQRDLAERLALALEAERHEVFIDRSDLAAGDAFHQTLREAILGADGLVFLVTPESVATGSYALAELSIARQRWRRPAGRVLPVLVAPTPIAALPPYLRAVTLLQPRGDAVAEIVAAVARLGRPGPGRGRLVVAVGAAAALALGGAGFLAWRGAEREKLVARRAVAEAASARELCETGDHALALQQLNELAGHEKPPPEVIRAREDCAMTWLREMRATVGKTTFGEQVAQVQPVLAQGLAGATGERAADLRAHLGWGEYLRGREGNPGVDPTAHWKRALEEDARNAYAHAMWARQLLDGAGFLDEAKPHFAQAVASARDRPFVRALQLGGTLGHAALTPYALTVADEMRRGGERVEREQRERLWSAAFASAMFHADERAALLAALPAADLLATFTWLFPAGEVREDRRPLWRLVKANLDASAGHPAAARADLEALVRDLRASKGPDRVLDEARRTLERMRRPAGSR